MDKEIIEGFIEEAESYLSALRGGILICSQEGIYNDALETSRRHAHTIKGAALMVGLEEIGKTAAALEKEIGALVADRIAPTSEQSRMFLDKISEIEALLVKQRFSEEESDFDFTDFVEASFDNIQFGSSPVDLDAEEIVEADVWEDFEIDDEMREVFALEAEELLQNIGANLERLGDAPNDREALMEIRRNAHTLKGSAGILGFKTISELAHHVEDLLDYVWENELEGNRSVFQLLRSSNDCLNSLVNDGDSAPLTQKIKDLASEFETIKKSLQEPVAAQTVKETIAENDVLENIVPLEINRKSSRLQESPRSSISRIILTVRAARSSACRSINWTISFASSAKWSSAVRFLSSA